MSEEQPVDRSVATQVADLVFYAPIGVVLEARRILPEVVDRGRRQVQLAHTVGRLAVRRGRRRADAVVERLRRLPETERPTADTSTRRDDAATAATSPLPALSARKLAIPEYDSLSASQVIPRLESLEAEELEAVRVYEAATRGRRTILGRVTQMQSA